LLSAPDKRPLKGVTVRIAKTRYDDICLPFFYRWRDADLEIFNATSADV
jgi:hypothetical protein